MSLPTQIRKGSVIYFFAMLLLFVIAFGIQSAEIICIIQIISVLKLWYECRKSQLLLILTFFCSLYTIPPIINVFFKIELSAYSRFNNSESLYLPLVIHTLFIFIISCHCYCPKTTAHPLKISSNDFSKYESKSRYYLMLLCALLCMFLGKSGQTIFERQGYGQSGSSSSAIYEYFCFFFLLSAIFAGNNQNKKYFLLGTALLYAMKSLLYGGRVEVIQILILVFILYFQDKFHTGILLGGLIGGYILMTLIGNFRGGLQFDFDSFSQLLGYNMSRNRLVNNESDVWYASAVILASLKTTAVTTQYRVIATIYYFIRLIVPSSLLNQTYNVVPYLQKYLTAFGGGGLFSAFLYFYFGAVGVILGAILIGKMFQGATKNSQSIFLKIFLIQSFTMLPRWFAYSPEAICKTAFYAVFAFYLLTRVRLK